MDIRVSTCTFCDGGCTIAAKIEGDDLQVFPANEKLPAICSKATMIDDYRLHPDRLTKPLKRKGDRGENNWEEISWDQALDEIATQLQNIISESGPESFAIAEMPLNIGIGGISRRLMNALGAVNYTAPVQLCMGNTAQVHRAVYGWFASPDWEKADLIVYFGQDRDMQRWPSEYLKLKVALARGAKLIEVDPRITETAKLADWHLRIKYGTDAALLLGWLNVIINEKLYDQDFVKENCIGFNELAERVEQYDPETVAKICNINAQEVIDTARAYASADFAIIPWGVVGDMQTNSTSMLQAQCILRAICGNLNKSEMVPGAFVGAITNSQIAAYEWLTDEQREKQLGRDTHSLLTFKSSDLYRERLAEYNLPYEPDLIAESCACSPTDLFAAMRGEGPYPVRALFSIGNNTLMSYAGQQKIQEALLALDLLVVYENWMTPTAQLADYVLPGDIWAERDSLGPAFDIAPVVVPNQAFREPVPGVKGWYEVVKGLADRLGIGEKFPWKDSHELYDYRLAPLGLTFQQLTEQHIAFSAPVAPGCFLTPSGKVELASSVLDQLGYDPLPLYREPKDPGAEAAGPDVYPYIAFAGYRERESYNTNFHQIEKLRAKEPEPRFFIAPEDAALEEVVEGEWYFIESAYGRVRLQAHIDEAQPLKSIRIPHGWWKPETQRGLAGQLSGANDFNDGMLFLDEDWNLDGPQGVPGLRGSIHVRVADGAFSA